MIFSFAFSPPTLVQRETLKAFFCVKRAQCNTFVCLFFFHYYNTFVVMFCFFPLDFKIHF